MTEKQGCISEGPVGSEIFGGYTEFLFCIQFWCFFSLNRLWQYLQVVFTVDFLYQL